MPRSASRSTVKPAPGAARPAPALRREAARSVDAPPALTPYFAELFAGISALGGSPRKTIRLLARAGLPRAPRIIDLGCGKGAASIEAARALRAHVTGIDALPVFLDAANALAARHHVEHRCDFHAGDIRAVARRPRFRAAFDAALVLGVMPVARAAPLARACVRPGALYAIDDAYLDPGAVRADIAPNDPTLENCRRVFARLGDDILEEWAPTPSATRRQNDAILRRLRANARRLALRLPSLRRPLAQFIERQECATETLGGPYRAVVWIVRRSGRSGGSR